MFPELSRGTDRVLKCLWRTTGEGQCVVDTAGVRRSVVVRLSARPGSGFALQLGHTWPSSVGPTDKHVLESELLCGILEGTVSCEDPPWACHIECDSVAWSPGEEHPTLLRSAASLAVQDLVRGGGWEAVGSPGDHVA
jgi:hypothetical protein